MKKSFLFFLLILVLLSCSNSGTDAESNNNASVDNLGWTIPVGLINGSGNPFALAKDPVLFPVKNVDFISDESLVAAISMNGEIRVYPYQYISAFESINDQMNDVSYALTYCPITQSTVVMHRDYGNSQFVLRASGYLLHDNVILWDETSETFWSQMLVQCVKGQYANEFNKTFHFIETNWKTVKENFPDAKVFSNSSITSQKTSLASKTTDVKTGDLVYGIIGAEVGKENKVYIYHYDDFDDQTTLKNIVIRGQQTLVIGHKKDHYITSYINDSKATFQALQNQFPNIMRDSDDNVWNIFGVAVSGPRKGDQLNSPTGFFALFWAWQKFYSEIVLDE
jgi:hypothetical protein